MKNNSPSVKKNYIFNALYQLFTILVPIVTTPYLSSTLLPDGIGKYSYTYSIVNFFIIFAQLGFGYYAQREIAKYQEDKHKQSVIFYEIMIVKTIAITTTLTIYIISCLSGIYGKYTSLMWFWVILLISYEFDIAFLYQGNENFKIIVFRNMIIKVLSIVFIFVFVKNPSHVWIYILSVSLGSLFGSISLWVYLPKYLCKVKVSELHPTQHIRPTLQMFIPSVAAIVYSYIDKTLIGTLIDGTVVDKMGNLKSLSEFENGFYEQSEKVIRVAISLITALGSVMLPRNAKEYASGNTKALTNNIYKSFNFVFMLGIPMTLGLIAITSNFVPWFFGSGYEKCILYLLLFSPMIILLGFENVLGIQLLLTTNREKQYAIAVITGIIVNVILNIIFIPKYYGEAAIISSIIAEFIIIVVMYYCVRKMISLKKALGNPVKYLISSIIMYIVLVVLKGYLNTTITGTAILILTGVSIYFGVLLLMRETTIINYAGDFINKIKMKGKKYEK